MLEVMSGGRGIDWLNLTMKWSRDGLLVNAQVDQRVEDFFSQVSGGQKVPLSTYGGKDWAPVGEDEHLLTYGISEETFRDTGSFYLGNPGYGFTTERYPNKINLSFLTLVGAAVGVKFLIKTPVSGLAKTELRTKIEKGMNEFVHQYLTFGKLAIRVMSSEG